VRKAGGANLDVAYALAGDGAGNLFLTGFFSDSATFGATRLTASGASPARDLFVTKLGFNFLPRLSLTSSNHTLLLTWPAAASDFALESAHALPALNWVPVSGPTNVVGPSRVVTITNAAPGGFFRLRK
jgi:hypothetical protein